tara:strand:+ start:944 stop:1171 length:228 start_codon:yes stop_codon:yes gene_type:complete
VGGRLGTRYGILSELGGIKTMSKKPEIAPVFQDIFDGMFKSQKVIADAVRKEVEEAENQALEDENNNKRFEKEIA